MYKAPSELCGRPVGGASCDSVVFSVDNYAYTRVCGRVTGYQYASPDAGIHYVYNPTPGNAINEPYLAGVSITHGSPRQHIIWSFYGSENTQKCCALRHINNMESLGFIGNNSFCDIGNPDNPSGILSSPTTLCGKEILSVLVAPPAALPMLAPGFTWLSMFPQFKT